MPMHILIFTIVFYPIYLMQNKMNVKLSLLGCLCCLLLFVSCDKGDNTIGLDTLPGTDLLKTLVDSTSTTITLSTTDDDSVRSSAVSYMVGEMNDDVMGKTRAGFVTRLYVQGLNLDDLANFVLDSACFRLSKSHKYVYGDVNTAQTFSLYEVTQDVTVEDCKNYCQSKTMPTCLSSLTPLMDIDFKKHADSDTSYLYKLPDEVVNAIFSKISACYDASQSPQHFDSLFIKQFKGIYLTTKNDAFNNAQSVIVHCIPELKFYFHNKSDATTESLVFAPSPQAYNKPLSSDPSQIYLQAINVYEHEYPTTISSNLNTEASETYVQGFNGLKTKVHFSGLESWRDNMQLNSSDPLLINIARLSIPLKESRNAYLPLNLRIYNDSRDLIYSTMSATKDSTCYLFDIQYFMQYLYDHSAMADDYSYEICIPENNIYGNAFVLDGTASNKLKLTITYTK